MAEITKSITAAEIGALRRQLQHTGGRQLWKALDEAADSATFRRWLASELPAAAAILETETNRRDVLRVMAASMLLAGLPGCDIYPPEDAVPWVEAPEYDVPGRPRHYATMLPFMGYARPVVAECHGGRPTRLDGNERLLGGSTALDSFVQAEVLRLYDPDRSTGSLRQGQPADLASTLSAVEQAFLQRTSGSGVRLLTGQATSPTLLRQIDALKERLPGLLWHAYESAGAEDQSRAAVQLAFGDVHDIHHHLHRTDLVVSLEADLLGPGPRQLRHAADWAERRRHGRKSAHISRLYVAESTPTLTGAKASGRLRVPSGAIPHLAASIARHLDVAAPEPRLTAAEEAWTQTMARRLQAARGTSLLAVGEHQPAAVQALALAINHQLGNFGRTVTMSEPVVATPDGGLAALADDMESGTVELLLMLDVDPAFDAPGETDFTKVLRTVPTSIHFGLYQDATAQASGWHLPLAHPLETWLDARTPDGVAVIGQPTVRPLYGGLHPHVLLDRLGGGDGGSAREIVRQTWREQLDEAAWPRALHDGFVPDTAAAEVMAVPRVPEVQLMAVDHTALELTFRPDPAVWDGRYANVSWLQELPKPLTKLTWDNAALVSPALAERLGIGEGQKVKVSGPSGSLVQPAWIVPGQAENTVTLEFGQGRHAIGRVAADAGTNVNPLRSHRQPWLMRDIQVRALDGEVPLADTQMHGSMEGHDLVRMVPAAEAAKPPKAQLPEPKQDTLYDTDFEHENRQASVYAWAMTIDLDACIGCNACVTACVAENNILVVGREEVRMGREMHWIRVDRYFEGNADDPLIHFQPVPCMHCEHAPCEVGCPVRATVHGPEGLNQMIYNRCIGTRTCSSYCPYKVRRFNWYDYSQPRALGIEAVRNPDVTVRGRGVMEKCTYCVQRISGARREAKKEGRRIRDGEVVTACQASCPTQAIVFGDQNDPTSKVAEAKRDPRDYVLLEELNVRPRTSYAARVRDDDEG